MQINVHHWSADTTMTFVRRCIKCLAGTVADYCNAAAYRKIIKQRKHNLVNRNVG